MSETGEPNKQIEEPERADVKYIYLDIVGYTNNRSVEAQSFIIGQLNKAVTDSVKAVDDKSVEIIFLPTGDGIAIAFLNAPSRSYDIHLRAALLIIQTVVTQNEAVTTEENRFLVRIGINENTDNVIIDVNDRRNVAGNGITMAERIMNQADGMQILVGEIVYSRLSPRKKYMKSFRRYSATGKHGVTFPVFQYVAEVKGLNQAPPSQFQQKQLAPPKYSRLVACYVAEAVANKSLLLQRNADGNRDAGATVLLYYRAEDQVERSTMREHEEPFTKSWGGGQKSFEEQYLYYTKVDWWTIFDLASFITQKYLSPYENFFDASGIGDEYLIFPNDRGVAKLKAEWPSIAKQCGL